MPAIPSTKATTASPMLRKMLNRGNVATDTMAMMQLASGSFVVVWVIVLAAPGRVGIHLNRQRKMLVRLMIVGGGRPKTYSLSLECLPDGGFVPLLVEFRCLPRLQPTRRDCHAGDTYGCRA